MQLYTQIVPSICSLSPPSTLSSFPPLTALSLYFALLSVPATQVARPKQMAFLACREAVNIARGDLGTQRSAASSASKASCFAAFPSEKKGHIFSRKSDVRCESPNSQTSGNHTILISKLAGCSRIKNRKRLFPQVFFQRIAFCERVSVCRK